MLTITQTLTLYSFYNCHHHIITSKVEATIEKKKMVEKAQEWVIKWIMSEFHLDALGSVLLILPHCHTVMGYWDTWKKGINVNVNTCAFPARKSKKY